MNFDLVSPVPFPLYVGRMPTDFPSLPATAVLSLSEHPPELPEGYRGLALPMVDRNDIDSLPTRNALNRFLLRAHRLAANESTYWHCHAGLNRSGFAVVAYLHLYRDLSVSVAIRALRAARGPMALCNPTFERALRDWYGGPEEQDFEPFSVEQYLLARDGHAIPSIDSRPIPMAEWDSTQPTDLLTFDTDSDD